jgi:hypothetical protein
MHQAIHLSKLFYLNTSTFTNNSGSPHKVSTAILPHTSVPTLSDASMITSIATFNANALELSFHKTPIHDSFDQPNIPNIPPLHLLTPINLILIHYYLTHIPSNSTSNIIFVYAMNHLTVRQTIHDLPYEMTKVQKEAKVTVWLL